MKCCLSKFKMACSDYLESLRMCVAVAEPLVTSLVSKFKNLQMLFSHEINYCRTILTE
jgi:hypothetical protein